MESNNNRETSKLNEALQLLEEAAREKKDELKEMVARKYENVRDIFTAGALSNLKEPLNEIQHTIQEGEKITKAAIATFDKQLRRDPWRTLSALAVGALAVGIIAGARPARGRRRRAKEDDSYDDE